MFFLLDTHILIWYLSADKHLKANKRKVIENSENVLYVSLVSLWEIAIKQSVEKLQFESDFSSLPEILRQYQIELLGLSFAHLEKVKSLPFHHRDPFDRLLVAQALTEELVLISEDPKFKQYPVRLL